MILEANLTWRYIDTPSNLILPWYTLPTLEWLKKQGTEEWNVFEYGCGYSSIWWKANSFFHFAIDVDGSWAIAMGAAWIREQEQYVNKILEFIGINCIVVDGHWRKECALLAVEVLSSGGILIIDNWNSEDFDPQAILEIEAVTKEWQTAIHKQPNHSTWQTAILIKP